MTDKSFDEAEQLMAGFELEDELLDARVSATVADGVYKGRIVEIKPVLTHYTETVTEVVAGVKKTSLVEKEGKIYNFIIELEDGRRFVDSRFTRDFEDPAKKYQAINVALGNIATQLGKNTITMRELLTEKPLLTVWVSRYGKNRNVDYLQPLPKQQPIASLNTENAPF